MVATEGLNILDPGPGQVKSSAKRLISGQPANLVGKLPEDNKTQKLLQFKLPQDPGGANDETCPDDDKSLLVNCGGDDDPHCKSKKAGDVPKKILKRSPNMDGFGPDKKSNKGIPFINNNNEDFILESKVAAKIDYGKQSRNWKKRDFLTPDEENQLRFPWKRMAYVVVLLVLGITCAILALMKLCGGADWMNTATFSVIIMGAVMLLPPGLYYGRILICICCRCREYSLWDVPAGPFG